MSIFIDTLADTVRSSIVDADATREDWHKALNQVFDSSETIDGLEPAVGTEEYAVVWEIDADGTSPADAAKNVWQQTFRRGYLQPNNDEACSFTVTDYRGRKTTVDLSEDRYSGLFGL